MSSQSQNRSADNGDVPFFESEIYSFEIPQWRTDIHRAQSWNLTEYGMYKIRVYEKEKCCTLKFYYDTLEVAESRIFQYPSSVLQPVVDSNRYFVLKISWKHTDKLEDVGICFYDRKQSKQFLSLLRCHLPPKAEELHDLKEETESSSRSGSSNSVQSSPISVTFASTKDSGIDRDLEDLEARFSNLSTAGVTKVKKQVSIVPQSVASTTEKIKSTENSISVIHQTIPCVPRTRVHSLTRNGIVKEEVDENIIFFDCHYPEVRIITDNYSKIGRDALKELRNLAPKQIIRPGLKN